jgi:beta-N-acetylhexosaminidase
LIQTDPEKEIDNIIDQMTLEEKVLQLFVITPEALLKDSALSITPKVLKMSNTLQEKIKQYPVGGFIYFKDNLKDPEQVTQLLMETKAIYQDMGALVPFLSLDEEGGTVSRIASQPAFGLEQSNPISTLEEAKTTGTVLVVLGFNMNYAPVVDVVRNPENTVIGSRSFGDNPETVIQISQEVSKGFEEAGIIPVFKHFPGHGSTSEDSHKEIAVHQGNKEALYEFDLPPFIEAIKQDCQVIMVGHIAVPSLTESLESACFSEKIVSGLLRDELEFENLIITDALNMKAVTNTYQSGDAAVMAIQAGVDLLLMPEDFYEAYLGVIEGIDQGIITEERIEESLRRILRQKLLIEN